MIGWIETELPPKEKFFNRLNEARVFDEEYDHVQNVWKEFNLKNTGDTMISILFMMFCFLLMSLRNSEKSAWKIIKSSMVLYCSWTSLRCCFEENRRKALTDVDMFLIIEEGIRSGNCIITKRYAKANNPYMGEE